MKRLGLSLTGSSPFVINMAHQSPVFPLGMIKDYWISTEKEEYIVIFQGLASIEISGDGVKKGSNKRLG